MNRPTIRLFVNEIRFHVGFEKLPTKLTQNSFSIFTSLFNRGLLLASVLLRYLGRSEFDSASTQLGLSV